MITSASGGYIVGFILAAAVTGLLAEHKWDRKFSSAVGAMLTGNVDHLPRRPALARGRAEHEPREDARVRAVPVRPGDLFKLYCAAALLPAAWAGVKYLDGR